MTRICESFATKRYNIETNKEAIFEKIKSIENTINDTKQLCFMTENRLKQDLENVVSIGEY